MNEASFNEMKHPSLNGRSLVYPEQARAHLSTAIVFLRGSLLRSLASSVAFCTPSPPDSNIIAAFAATAMAAAAAMAGTVLRDPSQLKSASSPRATALSSRNCVAFSGFSGSFSKANSTVGSIAFSNSSRSSVKAAMEVDISKIVPHADRVLIRLEKQASQSAGGVLLPSAAVKFDRCLQGEIIAAGSEVTVVEKGQKVMFADVNAMEVNLGTSDKLCFCRSGDLLAIVQ